MKLKYTHIKAERLFTWPNKREKAITQDERQLECLVENYATTVSREIQSVLKERLTRFFKRGIDFSKGKL